MATMDQLKTHIEKAKKEFHDAIKKAEDKKNDLTSRPVSYTHLTLPTKA